MKVIKQLSELPNFDRPVLTLGTFDGVHVGHQTILKKVVQEAKERSTDSVVISFSPHPREVIYPKDRTLQLITTVEEKIDLLSEIGIDYFVLIPFKFEFSQLPAEKYIQDVVLDKFNPSKIIIGFDHRFGLNRSGNPAFLKSNVSALGIEVEIVKEQKLSDLKISSTEIRKALANGELERSKKLLGRVYSFYGKVISGDKLGRKMGYPTANLKLHNTKKILPQNGIYAAKVMVEDGWCDSMLYIGNRATINDNNQKSIEVHILDFDREIYDENIKVEIHAFIRKDEKFKNVRLMTDAIALDENAIRSYFRHKSPSPSDEVKVTVAVLNYNGKDLLNKYFKSNLYPSETKTDVVVIDNGSTDESLEYLSKNFQGITTITLNENYGFAEGYNKGLEKVKSEYVVLLNSDVEVTPNWLDPIIEFMDNNKEIAAVQPKILSWKEKESFEYAGAAGGMMDRLGYPFCRGRILDELEDDQGQYNDIKEIFWASGAAMVIRTDLYKKFNGLDSSYFAHQEEIDLCWRLKNAGHKIFYFGKSQVYHLGGGTLNYSNPKKIYLNYRNNLMTIFKNESKSNLIQVLILRYILDMGGSFYFLISGKWRASIAIWKAYVFLLFQLPQSLKKRHKNKNLIQRFKIKSPNNSGRYSINLPWRFYIQGKKIFSEVIDH